MSASEIFVITPEGQLVAFGDLLNNLIDLHGDLTSFEVSQRGLLALIKEGNVLFDPSAWVLRFAPYCVMPVILDHLVVSDQYETRTVRLLTFFA